MDIAGKSTLHEKKEFLQPRYAREKKIGHLSLIP
jgi:hypothetical protein